ncbi:predicted protein, partial [Nematostella vectensis]
MEQLTLSQVGNLELEKPRPPENSQHQVTVWSIKKRRKAFIILGILGLIVLVVAVAVPLLLVLRSDRNQDQFPSSKPVPTATPILPTVTLTTTRTRLMDLPYTTINATLHPSMTSLVPMVTSVAVNPHWSEWSPWSNCSVSCGNGTQSRSRNCSHVKCKGDSVESRVCVSAACK